MQAKDFKIGMRIIANGTIPGVITKLSNNGFIRYTNYEGKNRLAQIEDVQIEKGAPIVNFDEVYDSAYQYLAIEKPDELKAHFENNDNKIKELQSLKPLDYEAKYNPMVI